MQYQILSFAAILKSNEKVIGNAQVCYHYHYYPHTEKQITQACFVTANILLLSKEDKIYSDSWLEDVIKNSWNNEQGVKLVLSLLREELGKETSLNIDVQIERYNLHQPDNHANHVIIMRHHKEKRQFVFLPGILEEKEIPYLVDFKEIAVQYLK